MVNAVQNSAENWLHLVSDFLQQKAKNPLIVIIGPTASGKTALSLKIAKAIQSLGFVPEIVNADSRQLYKGLDVGTAKISEEEMQGIPHHLLSILSPQEPTSIAWFQKTAESVLRSIYDRRSIPILVGGSMLYVSSVIDGLVPVSTNASLRISLGEEYDRDNGISLHARLTEVDPDTAASIPRENRVYVLRAMEIIETTGKSKSKSLSTVPCPYNLLLLGIAIDREVLRRRLHERTQEMFERGWINEVKNLLAQGYDNAAPAMESHGYREIISAIQGGRNPGELLEEIVTKGMQYAKRHQTWWKKDSRVHWIQAT